MTLRVHLSTETTGHLEATDQERTQELVLKLEQSTCEVAVTKLPHLGNNLPLPEDSYTTWPFSLTPPLQQQLHWSLPPCDSGCPIHPCHVPAQTHTLLIYAQAPLSRNPPGSLHQLPSILLSPPPIRTSAEIPHVMKALISTLWLQWGKVRGRKAVKHRGDYVFLHSRLCRKTWHRIRPATTAALLLNEWTGTFLFNREPAAVPAQNNHSTEHKSCASFSLCARTHYTMPICLGGNTPRCGNRVPIEYTTILWQTQGHYKSKYDLKNVPVCAVEMHD